MTLDYSLENYWDVNPHLKFLMERNFGDEFNEILDVTGKMAAEDFSKYVMQNNSEGCKLEKGEDGNNVVKLPEKTEEALNIMRAQGLIGMTLPEKYGGQDLPHTLNGAINLIMCMADDASFLIHGLTEGVAETLFHFASEELKEKYIPKLVNCDIENALTGAMLLTEPHAGSDLGPIKTSAKKQSLVLI